METYVHKPRNMNILCPFTKEITEESLASQIPDEHAHTHKKNYILIPCWFSNRLSIDAQESAMLIKMWMFPQTMGN